MEKNKDVNVIIEPINFNITPFAMAGISEDLYGSSIAYSSNKRFPVVNFFLYAASIEIGLKSAILSKDCTFLGKNKIKKLGHHLDKVLECFKNEVDSDLFSNGDIEVILSVNVFYHDKGLEYFTTPMIGQAMKAFKDFPPLEDFSKVAKKVNELIKINKYFI